LPVRELRVSASSRVDYRCLGVPYLSALCDACRLAHLVPARAEDARCWACAGTLRLTGLQAFEANQVHAFVELARAVRSAGLDAEQCQILLGALALLEDDDRARRDQVTALGRVLPAVSLARVAARGDDAAVSAMLRLVAEVLRARASAMP